MAWRGSISRSLANTARSLRNSPPSSSAFRGPSPPISAPRLPRRVPSFSSPSPSRPLNQLGLQPFVCKQGLATTQLLSRMQVAGTTACQASCKVITRRLASVAAYVGDRRNIRDYKRRLLAAKYELRRKLYKAICHDVSLPPDLRAKHRYKLSKLPRNSAFSRIRNRCIYTGRPRSVYRLFRTSRIVFRELASQGSLMGVKKASW